MSSQPNVAGLWEPRESVVLAFDAMVPRVALFLRGHDDYQEALREECEAAARRHRFDVSIFSTLNDVATQLGQIEQCIASHESIRPTALLVQPVSEVALVSVSHAAARKGIGWVLLNRWSDSLLELRQEFPSLPVFCVSPDQYEVGRLQGRQFLSLLPRGGELVYIRGPLGTSSATRRLEGVHEMLQGAGIHIFTVSSDWTTSGGEQAMRDWMHAFHGGRFPRFMVGAQNDAMARGALKAFEAAATGLTEGAQRVHFTGCDGSPAFGRRLVNDGALTATVVVPPTSGRAVSEVASMLSGGPRPPADVTLAVHSLPELSDLSALAQEDERKATASERMRASQRPSQRPRRSERPPDQ